MRLELLEETAGAFQLHWHMIVEREGGEKPCCVADWLLRYYE